MSYTPLGYLGAEIPDASVPTAPVVDESELTEAERQEIQEETKAVVEKPMPPPKALAEGSPETEQLPGPTPEEIDYVYRQVRDYIGDAVLEELDFRMVKILKGYGRDVKYAMISIAAIDTGVSVALLCIPVVGWIASAVYSVVMAVVRGFTGSALQSQAQQIIANAQNEATMMEAVWDAKFADLQDQIIRQETPYAIKLAMAIGLGENIPVPTPPGMQGLAGGEGLGNIALALQMFAVAKEQEFQQKLQTMTPEEQQAAHQQRQADIAKTAAVWVGTSATVQKQVTQGISNTITQFQEMTGQKDPEDDRSTWDKVKDSAKADGILQLATGGLVPPGAVTAMAVHPDPRVQALAQEVAAKTIAWQKGGMDYVSGHIVVTKAKEAARQLLEVARTKQMALYAITKSKMDHPDFRANIRLAIAQQILSDPSIQKMLANTLIAKANINATLEPEQVGLKPVARKKKALILGGSAAAAAAAWFLMR